jgi:hypothetical protein
LFFPILVLLASVVYQILDIRSVNCEPGTHYVNPDEMTEEHCESNKKFCATYDQPTLSCLECKANWYLVVDYGHTGNYCVQDPEYGIII